MPKLTPAPIPNPRRGKPNLDLAEALYRRFGLGTLAPLAQIDAFLMEQQQMPTTATAIERNHYRGVYLKKVGMASTTPYMRERGIPPFEIICNLRGRGWRLEATTDSAERKLPLTKILTQTKRSSRRQRYVLESLDPSRDRVAYLQASVDMSLTGVMEDIAVVAIAGATKAGEDAKKKFAALMQDHHKPALAAGDA